MKPVSPVLSLMNFVPHMQSVVRGFTPEGDVRWRSWHGAVADVWTVRCEQAATGRYVSQHPRLFVVLEQTPGSVFRLTQPATGATGLHDAPGRMSFVPADVVVEGHAEGLRHLTHLDLHFSEAVLLRRFGRAFNARKLQSPRLGFADDRIFALVRLLAEEFGHPLPGHAGYGDALIGAICALLFNTSVSDASARTSLTNRQLRLAQDYIEAHCFERLRLGDIAASVNLSPSHFSHAFKSATGTPPLQWLMEARIRKVQGLIRQGGLPLTDIASLAGFSDQAHLTRVFKRHVGATPSEWRRGLGLAD